LLYAAERDGLHSRGKRGKQLHDFLALRIGHLTRCGEGEGEMTAQYRDA
jgi:hypothetical protein